MERYREVMDFMERNHRNPSKYDAEERGRYYNWIKHNRKVMKAGEMKLERVGLFEVLLEKIGENRRVNQWK